jgi:hypothetical protein
MVPTLGHSVFNTGTCLCPRRVPGSGKLGLEPRFHRLRQCLHQHQLLLYVCLDRFADFVFAYSVLAKPKYDFVPDVRLVLSKLGPHFVLDGSDYIDSGIDTSLRRLTGCIFVILHAHYALVASCAATSTPAPDHNIDHGNSLHGYHDQGSRAQRSRQPRYQYKGYHLA